jgi:hypothetical protein
MHLLVLLHICNHTILCTNFETQIPSFTYMFPYDFTYVAINHLEAVFRDRWFGRGVARPLQPHDLAPFDLFHCGLPRSLICDTAMKTNRIW